MTLSELKALKNSFEMDGSIAIGVHLTQEQAKALRQELYLLYGFDNGENLTTLYGVEVLAIDAEMLKFE
ncbi:MAG: hypothetical protein HQL67_12670 [Magnetococcales bacterium]|nr:hypothetical protein [Magnetococcales bacterium]